MKDSPAIACASGLLGVLGFFCPVASGEVLDYSFSVLGETLSLESLGFFSASKLVFVPSLLTFLLGGWAVYREKYSRGEAFLTVFLSLLTLLAWMFQKTMIEQLSLLGVSASLGLFLLGIGGLSGLVAGALGFFWPQEGAAD